jgi:hypothetical protein
MASDLPFFSEKKHTKIDKNNEELILDFVILSEAYEPL